MAPSCGTTRKSVSCCSCLPLSVTVAFGVAAKPVYWAFAANSTVAAERSVAGQFTWEFNAGLPPLTLPLDLVQYVPQPSLSALTFSTAMALVVLGL